MMQRSQPQLNSLAEQDLELLSAYLDNRLGAAERVSLERRLGGDPRLQSELEALRSTVTALRSLDPAPLPRSFTLDPATVARPRAFFPLSWAMQLGSGFAGLALVLLATVQLLVAGALPAAAPMTAPAAAAPTTMAAAPTTMAAAAAAPLPGAEMRLPEATAAPVATAAPAAASAAAPEAAPAADMSAQSPAGGVAGGPQSNSTPPIDVGSSSVPSGAVQSSESSSPGTLESALEPGPSVATKGAAPGGINPGLTLAIGLLLIGLALGWNLATRRRTTS